MGFAVSRIDHAVFWVSDLPRSRDFYCRVFGMDIVACEGGMCLLRARASNQHHDLGLFEIGAGAPNKPARTVGLYHIAWKVEHIEDLQSALESLTAEGALKGASDHGATKSVYGVDPDGNEFEIVFTIPRKDWGDWANGGTVAPLDLAAEIERYGRQV